MLNRYEDDFIAEVWSDTSKIARWVEVELAVLSAQVVEGVLPDSAWKQAVNQPVPTPEQVREQEQYTRHDVVAFLDAWGAEFAHLGMTSSDLVETAQALAIEQTTRYIVALTVELSTELHHQATKHWRTYRVGRTHGQRGTVDLWGHRVADFMLALDRGALRLISALADCAVAKISGPTGTYADISRDVECVVAEELGLRPTPVASQIVMRDSLVHWAHCLSNLVSVCEAIATEIRLSAHGNVGEIRESFGSRQKGSSAMPHKRNPITAERICGMARLARTYATSLESTVVQWHERDMAHSSIERVVLPDLSHAVCFVLSETRNLVESMKVNTHIMFEQVMVHDDVYSHRVLAALMRAGIPRKQAHDVVQEASRDAHKTSFGREIRAKVSKALPDTFVDWEEVFSLESSVQGLNWLGEILKDTQHNQLGEN
jgi:adenylosuccinate lyase